MTSVEPDQLHDLAEVVEWGVATAALPGESESGDDYLVQPFSGGVLLAVVDGLGHGHEAAVVARRALAVLARYPQEELKQLLQRCHQELQGSRGVVVSLAAINAAENTLTWLSVGNVDGQVVRSTSNAPDGRTRYALVPRGGVIGYRLPALQTAAVPLAPGDLLIFATDGIASDFSDNLPVTDSPQRLADLILARFRKTTDDALVLVARYRGRTP